MGVNATKVSDIMSKNLKKAHSKQTLGEVNQMMAESKIHHLLVVDDADKLIGVVSDRDIKKFISPFVGSKRETEQDKATLLIKVENIMVKNVITCRPEDTIKTIVELMLQKIIHSTPVVDDSGKLVGLVTSTDLLKLFLTSL